MKTTNNVSLIDAKRTARRKKRAKWLKKLYCVGLSGYALQTIAPFPQKIKKSRTPQSFYPYVSFNPIWTSFYSTGDFHRHPDT